MYLYNINYINANYIVRIILSNLHYNYNIFSMYIIDYIIKYTMH